MEKIVIECNLIIWGVLENYKNDYDIVAFAESNKNHNCNTLNGKKCIV